MDHVTFLRSLPAEQRAELRVRSDIAGLRHLAGHVGALAITTVLIVLRVPGWPVAVLAHGILLVFLFTLLHESVHRTPFRTRWLNDGIGALVGLLVCLGPTWFRAFHLEHHRFTNIEGRDPELASPRPGTTSAYLMYLSGLPEFVDRFRTLLRNATRTNTDAFVSDTLKPRVKLEARIQLALYAGLFAGSVAAGSAVLLWTWLIPTLIGAPFLRAYLLAEHAGCPFGDNMFTNTRTTFTNLIVRFLAWNMPYHAEHHAYPAVPFHRLADFHRLIAEHLAVTEDGYARFNREYLQDIRSKERSDDVGVEGLEPPTPSL